jgi:hypothetical protein
LATKKATDDLPLEPVLRSRVGMGKVISILRLGSPFEGREAGPKEVKGYRTIDSARLDGFLMNSITVIEAGGIAT